MGIFDEKLWLVMCENAEKEDESLPGYQKIASKFISGVQEIAEFGRERALTIRDTFPMFTLHDETHICNVMRIMEYLLGERINDLSRDEAAMLVLAACCHDIGMSVSERDKAELLRDIDRINKYLDCHHSEYVKAYSNGSDTPQMTDEMIQNYFRTIHHERVWDLLGNVEWPFALEGHVDRNDLIKICQSHGKDTALLANLEPRRTVDLRFCAILLRLSDILDYDTSRAPRAVYEYSGLNEAEGASFEKNREEWHKHFSSRGFDFIHIKNREAKYLLDFSATCKSMNVEQTVNSYLDWVDKELADCDRELSRFEGKWKDLVLPDKITRNITAEGYVSGQYRLTLDQEQVMDLLVGKDLYSDPAVFVRELIQNAIDAVRTREQLDKNLPRGWKPQIKIRTWMDNEGYHWFRIEDNGIGMTEDVIKNYFLKIGRSYYNSDTFKKEKIRCGADDDYMPISRFGIGILSCFMGDKDLNRVEVSTKHFNENGNYYPALRMSMHGMNGYYYLANKDMHHLPDPMKGISNEEKELYLREAGTVIAVRTNLYQTGHYRTFKEIVDRYVVYPPVAISYQDQSGEIYNYPTEQEFMEDIHNINPSDDLDVQGTIEFQLSEQDLEKIHRENPYLKFEVAPKVVMKCAPLDRYTESQYLSGAIIMAKVVGEHKPVNIKIGDESVKADVDFNVNFDKENSVIGLKIELDFESGFKEKINLFRRKYSDREYYIRMQYNKLAEECENNFIYDIIRAVRNRMQTSADWENYMMQRFDVSRDVLNSSVKEVEDKIAQKTSLSEVEEREYEVWCAYEKMKLNWKFDLCKLENYDWYKKHFKETQNRTENVSITAHNGVFCGNARFLRDNGYRSIEFGTIVLLKDRYRPGMDVSRDGIKFLPLETESEFEIIKKHIRSQGYSNYSGSLNNRVVSYIVMSKFTNLLSLRSDLMKQLMFETEYGKLDAEQIREIVKSKRKVEISKFPGLSNKAYSSYNLYDYLCVACLRAEFSLRMDFSKSYNKKIYVIDKEKDFESYENTFPANFFIKPLNAKKYTCLTTRSTYNRYCCNADHRLSQFIINNGERLKEYVPGIFKEILRTLAEEEGENLINNINDMLRHLRDLPNSPFEFSNDLFLTSEDLS